MNGLIDISKGHPLKDGRYLVSLHRMVFIAIFTLSNKKWQREAGATGLNQSIDFWMALLEAPKSWLDPNINN